jgi:NAD(P)-dependent dehydrogenase (short-subunit alcohol dehydrogenase family)
MLAVNTRAPHVLVAELAPAMASRGSGVIVTVGPWMASVGSGFAALYTATKAADEQLTAGTPAGHPVSPDDIAHAVAFLASRKARMIHGITLYVDGGINATRLG